MVSLRHIKILLINGLSHLIIIFKVHWTGVGIILFCNALFQYLIQANCLRATALAPVCWYRVVFVSN